VYNVLERTSIGKRKKSLGKKICRGLKRSNCQKIARSSAYPTLFRIFAVLKSKEKISHFGTQFESIFSVKSFIHCRYVRRSPFRLIVGFETDCLPKNFLSKYNIFRAAKRNADRSGRARSRIDERLSIHFR
jgi:hypothetical protein